MHHRPTRFRLAAQGAVAALALAGCANQPAETETPMEPSSMEPAPSSAEACAMLAEDPGWYGDNREKLNEMIASVGECGGEGDVANGAPLALFDWDNTVVKNDIGDATTFWMLANGHVLQPADWATFSAFFTPRPGPR